MDAKQASAGNEQSARPSGSFDKQHARPPLAQGMKDTSDLKKPKKQSPEFVWLDENAPQQVILSCRKASAVDGAMARLNSSGPEYEEDLASPKLSLDHQVLVGSIVRRAPSTSNEFGALKMPRASTSVGQILQLNLSEKRDELARIARMAVKEKEVRFHLLIQISSEILYLV